MPATPPSDVAAAEDAITINNEPSNPVVLHLQQLMADITVLHFNYKQYHWRTSGPHFRDHHLLFESFAKECLASLDEVAERIRMIGQEPLPGLIEVLQVARVIPTTVAAKGIDSSVKEADDNAILIIQALREAIRASEENDDPGTVDLLAKTLRDFEKQEWYLRELLKP